VAAEYVMAVAVRMDRLIKALGKAPVTTYRLPLDQYELPSPKAARMMYSDGAEEFAD
jgi:hypothetical protein